MYFKIKADSWKKLKQFYFFTLSNLTVLAWHVHIIYLHIIPHTWHLDANLIYIYICVCVCVCVCVCFTCRNFNLQPNILIFTHILVYLRRINTNQTKTKFFINFYNFINLCFHSYCKLMGSHRVSILALYFTLLWDFVMVAQWRLSLTEICSYV